MKKEYQNIISQHLGVEPIEINSALVSAQNRKRLYWTNIPGIELPEDKRILLKDIIEDGEVDRDKSYCVLSGIGYRTSYSSYRDRCMHQIVIMQRPRGNNKGGLRALDGKVPSMTANSWHENNKIAIDGTHWRKLMPEECEALQTVPRGYTNHVSPHQRYKMLGNGWTIDVISHIFSYTDFARVSRKVLCAA